MSGRGWAGSRIAWAALGAVAVVTLSVGALGERPPANDREAVIEVARTLACPTCDGESAAVSEALVSQEMRAEIRRQLDEGRTPEEIRAWFAAPERYGPGVLLDPGTEGVALAVWLVPILATAASGIALAVVLRRWSGRGRLEASEEDRALVERVLAAEGGAGGQADAG